MTKLERSTSQAAMFSLISRWQESGLSQIDFCQQHDLVPHRFYYWLKKYKQSGTTSIVSFRPFASCKFQKHSRIDWVFLKVSEHVRLIPTIVGELLDFSEGFWRVSSCAATYMQGQGCSWTTADFHPYWRKRETNLSTKKIISNQTLLINC